AGPTLFLHDRARQCDRMRRHPRSARGEGLALGSGPAPRPRSAGAGRPDAHAADQPDERRRGAVSRGWATDVHEHVTRRTSTYRPVLLVQEQTLAQLVALL